MNRWTRCLSVIVSGLLVIVARAYAQKPGNGLGGLTISPMMFREVAHPGAKPKLRIEIQNLQQSVLTFNLVVSPVTFQDWTYLPQFGRSHDHDCSSWIGVTQLNRNVQPSSTVDVDLPVSVPHVQEGVYWCMVCVNPHFQNDPSTILAQYQIPVIMFIGPQARPTLRLGTPTLSGTNAGAQINVPFESTGAGFTVIGATVELRQAPTGRLLATLYDSDRNLYPGTKRDITFGIGALVDGQYLIVSKAQAGTRGFGQMIGHYTVSKDGIKPTSEAETYAMCPVTLDPGGIHMTMPPGGQRITVVRVVNTSDKPVSVSMAVRTLGQTSDGGFQLGDVAPSGPLTVAVEPSTLQIDPGRSESIRLTLTGAMNASGDQWFGLSAKTSNPNEIAEEIYGDVAMPGGVPKLELAQLALKKIGKYPFSLRFAIKNPGSMALKPVGFAQVLEQGLTPVANLQVPLLGGGGILPGSQLENEVELPPNLKPGAYTINVKYQYGEDLFANLVVPVTVPGPTASGGGRSP